MWLDEDQDEVLGVLRERARCCSGCGVHPDDKRHLTVTDPIECETCEQLQRAQRTLGEDELGVTFGLEPIAVAVAREAGRAD